MVYLTGRGACADRLLPALPLVPFAHALEAALHDVTGRVTNDVSGPIEITMGP